jgi:hypothetical protein
LAHVVAKHAGFDTIEINASDDRKISTFAAKLNALESQNIKGKNK